MYASEHAKAEKEHLLQLTQTGRLPISANNINIVIPKENLSKKNIINQYSMDADLTIIGFQDNMLDMKGAEVFEGYDDIGTILFLSTMEQKKIT